MSYIHRNVSKVIKFYRSGVAAPSNVGVWVKVGLYTLNVRLRIKFYRRNICQQFNPKGGGGGYIYVWVGLCNPDGVYVHVVEDF